MKKIYTLVLMLAASASIFASSCSNLFFSEYMEGSSNNKALEIYNPTSVAVNMAGYRVLLFPNGATSPSVTFNLSGVIAPGDVYVIINSQADSLVKLLADTLSGVTAFTGNDAVVLLQGIDTLDVIGSVGANPGIGWQIDTFTTATSNHTLIRKSSVNGGTSNWVLGATQWDVLAQDVNQLGAHTGPTGYSLCTASSFDTLASFAPVAGTFSGVNGSFNLDVSLNTVHAGTLLVDVEILSGNAAWLNNYTTQTVNFPSNTTQRTVALTITNDTTGQQTHVVTFRLTNALNGLKIGADSIFTLTLTPFAAIDTCGSLFFSEYDEPSVGSNKALEIYNPTNGVITLDGYKVCLFTNGNVTAGSTFNLTGTLSPGNVYVLVNTQADSVFKLLADTLTGGVTAFNGNDAVALINGTDTIDVIGVVGVDPGSNGWTVDTGSTTNHALVRKSAVKSGTKSWPVSATQWDVLGVNVNDLGNHVGPHNITPCVIYSGVSTPEENSNAVRVYPNPNNGRFTIELQNASTAEIRLFSMTGQLVYTTKENGNHISIDANNLSAGIYVAEIKVGNQITRSRISVQ